MDIGFVSASTGGGVSKSSSMSKINSDAVGRSNGLFAIGLALFFAFFPVDGRDGGRFQSKGVEGRLVPPTEEGSEVPSAEANWRASCSSWMSSSRLGYRDARSFRRTSPLLIGSRSTCFSRIRTSRSAIMSGSRTSRSLLSASLETRIPIF